MFSLSYRETVCTCKAIEKLWVLIKLPRNFVCFHQAIKKICLFSPSYRETMCVFIKLQRNNVLAKLKRNWFIQAIIEKICVFSQDKRISCSNYVRDLGCLFSLSLQNNSC